MTSAVELLGALALTATLLAPPAARTPAPAAVALARRIERRHRAATDLTARFVQTYRSGLIGREVVERGVVSIKRPGRMLWEYRQPEKKTFVADGKSFYFYVPADKQVIVRPQAGDKSITGLLLSGQSDLVSEFDVSVEPAPPGLQRLRLVPRKTDPEVEWVTVDVDDDDRIRAIAVTDIQGNRSRFDFDGIRENVGLKDRLFQFRTPPGVEVVTG
jgi:outer membrane lipoprotein carrier protein